MKAATHAGVVHLAAACRLAAALLIALAAARLAFVTVLGAMAARAPKLAAPAPSAAASASAAPPASSSASRARTAGRAATPGKSTLVNLVVTVGGRSEIYVDHAYVGKSPYIGDVSCKVGGTVIVQLVPDKGAPRVFKRECVEGGTIQIGD